MSRAVNTANLGATLQNTTGNELSGGGNIRAVTFQGSGRLLTDIFTTTGGNIVIPFGPGSNFPNLAAALNSISAFVFDDTANVILKATEGTQTFSSNLLIDHPYSDKISISGSSLQFQTTFAVNFSGSDTPVTGVSGGKITSTAPITGFALSATITYDPAYSVPAVGDYVLISGVSGRHAQYTVGGPWQGISVNGRMAFSLQMDWPGYSVASAMFQSRGNKILVNKFTNTGQISSAVFTVSGSQFAVPFSFSNRWIVCEEAYDAAYSNITDATFAVANPQAYRGTTFTQAGNTLTFSDATATNTYLNPGDLIVALGQTVRVDTVGSSNTCTVSSAFYSTATPPTSGVTQTITIPRPFFIKTCFERYRGCHQVRQVNTSNNTCVIEIFNWMFMGGEQFPNPHGILYPLPRYGIHSIGAATSFPGIYASDANDFHKHYAGLLMKSRLNISNVNVTCNGSFRSFQNFVFVSNPTTSRIFEIGTVIPTTLNWVNIGFAGIGENITSDPVYGNNRTYSIYLSVADNSTINARNCAFSLREMNIYFRGGASYLTTNACSEFNAYNSLMTNVTIHDGILLRMLEKSTLSVFVFEGPIVGAGYNDATVGLTLSQESRAEFGVYWSIWTFGYCVRVGSDCSLVFSSIHLAAIGIVFNGSTVYGTAYCHVSNFSSRGIYVILGNHSSSVGNTIIGCSYGVYAVGANISYSTGVYGFSRGGSIGGMFALCDTAAVWFSDLTVATLSLYLNVLRNNSTAILLQNSSSTSLIASLIAPDQSFNTVFVGGGLVAGATTGFTSAPATGNLLTIS